MRLFIVLFVAFGFFYGCNRSSSHFDESKIKILAEGVNHDFNVRIDFEIKGNASTTPPTVLIEKTISDDGVTNCAVHIVKNVSPRLKGIIVPVSSIDESGCRFSIVIPIQKNEYPVNCWINGKKELGKISLSDKNDDDATPQP